MKTQELEYERMCEFILDVAPDRCKECGEIIWREDEPMPEGKPMRDYEVCTCEVRE